MAVAEPELIWVCETGEYDQGYMFGAWRSLEAGVAAVKAKYGAPYKVVWTGPGPGDTRVLMGDFAYVPRKSTKHREFFEFSTMELTG